MPHLVGTAFDRFVGYPKHKGTYIRVRAVLAGDLICLDEFFRQGVLGWIDLASLEDASCCSETPIPYFRRCSPWPVFDDLVRRQGSVDGLPLCRHRFRKVEAHQVREGRVELVVDEEVEPCD